MKNILFISILTFFFGCSHKEQKLISIFSEEQIASLQLESTKSITILKDSIVKINFNPVLNDKDFDFWKMLKSMRFIPLETTDESLIGGIKNIILSDSNIFILDTAENGSVLIFDNQGNFVKRITQGQGPEEVIDPKWIEFDRARNELIILHNIYFSIYSPKGEFLRKENIPLTAHVFALTENGYFFQSIYGAYNRHIGEQSEDNQIFITDREFKLLSSGFHYYFDQMNSFNTNQYLSPNYSKTDFYFALVDTIYQYVNENTVRAKYFFDKSSMSFPENFLITADFDQITAASSESDYIMFLGDFAETKKHLYTRFSSRKRLYMSVFFVDKNNGHIQGGTIGNFPADSCPGIGAPVAATDSCFISYLYPHDFIANIPILHASSKISKAEISKLHGIKEDDNPVLMFYELKDF
jgi:hypothetical protein